MLGSRRSPVFLAVALTGCPASDDPQPVGGTGTGSTSVEPQTSTGMQTSTRGASTAGSTGTSGGADISFEEFTELCEAQADRAGCGAAGGFESESTDEPQFANCVWETETPVELGDDGTCTFGEPTGQCIVDTGSTVGCASGGGVECGVFRPGVGRFGGIRETESGTVLVEAVVCTGIPDTVGCFVDGDGVALEDSPPVCACMCDPAWPG